MSTRSDSTNLSRVDFPPAVGNNEPKRSAFDTARLRADRFSFTMSPPPSPESQPETVSHYRLEALLGRGGMGAVYKGIDRRDGTVVAVKLLHAHLAEDESFRERFEREAHVAALLRSPYTVHLLDYGIVDDKYFLVMEFVEGRTLRRKIDDEGRVDVQEALRIATRIARALEEAEARSVVHRDIKPDNILLGDDGSVKLADFGIARQLGSSAVTMPGVFVGTLVYAAPEIARGEVDHRSDIYSLGATLYDILTGRPPFEGTALEVLRQHADSPVPLDPLDELPEAVRKVVLRSLEKNTGDRYQSATELASGLEEAARAIPTPLADELTQISAAPPEVEKDDVVATEVMRPPAATASTAGSGVHLRLSDPKTGFFASRFGSSRYELSLINSSDDPATVNLNGESSQNLAVISVPSSVTVPGRNTLNIPVSVRSRNRRSSGSRQSIPFTISASAGEGQPPSTVSGSFEDVPFDQRPLFALLGAGIASAVAVAAILLLAGGSDNGSALSEGELAAMMLTPRDLVPAFSRFNEDSRLSGPRTNRDLIAEACDDEDVRIQLEREGRLTGYESVYRPSRVSSLALEIRTRVDQYDTMVGASEALAFYAETQVERTGELTCTGVLNVAALEFPVAGIGDEARGIQVTRAVGSAKPQASRLAGTQGTEVVTTAIAFVLDDLVGRVEVDGDPDGDYQGLARDLALKLEARMEAVLSGSTAESPTPTPSVDPSVSASPTGSPSASATATPTPRSETPTNQPTSQATPKPTVAATGAPTAAPTALPAPTISSVGCPGFVDVNDTVSCNPTVSGNVTSRSWTAPGGSPSSGSGASFSTTYNTGGMKWISLTACNGTSCTSTDTTVEVAIPLPTSPSGSGDYIISIDSVFSVGQDTFVTVDLYIDAPNGLGFWDIDVLYDGELLTPWNCSASIGECDPFSPFIEDSMNFVGVPSIAIISPFQTLLGSLTFLTNFTPGLAGLFVDVFDLEDADGNIIDDFIEVDGAILIQ
ncbi:MAG: protein kinase [Chloroflexi bacterium]|nr:protein kinase [Chloroflexota bacterium]